MSFSPKLSSPLEVLVLAIELWVQELNLRRSRKMTSFNLRLVVVVVLNLLKNQWKTRKGLN